MTSATVVSFPSTVRRWKNGGTEGRPKWRDCWRTPPALFDLLDARFKFTVDAACTSENALCSERLAVDLGHDAFLEDWGPVGSSVWCNPPYSCLRPWLDRAALQAMAGRTVVALIPCDTSTRYWSEVVATLAWRVIFLVGRVRFVRPDGTDHRTTRGGGGITSPCAVVVFRAGRRRKSPIYSYLQAPR